MGVWSLKTDDFRLRVEQFPSKRLFGYEICTEPIFGMDLIICLFFYLRVKPCFNL